jgi:hypothetical protein
MTYLTLDITSYRLGRDQDFDAKISTNGLPEKINQNNK